MFSFRKFFRFILVGILNTLFSYSIFALLLFLGAHYSVATVVATTLGVLFNFKTVGRLVFQVEDNRLLFRFIMVYLLTNLLNIGSLKFLAALKVDLYIAGILLAPPMALVTFLLQNKFVFRQDAAPAGSRGQSPASP